MGSSVRPIDPFDEALLASRQKRTPLPDVLGTADSIDDFDAAFKALKLTRQPSETTQARGPVVAPKRSIGEDAAAVAGHFANVAQGIPGMEAAQSGISSFVNGIPYSESRDAIREQTGKIPMPLRMAEQAIGGYALGTSKNVPAFFKALSPATQGAVIGGAGGLLNADDDGSAGGLAMRGAKTALGAGLGGFLGKASEALGTRAKAPSDNNAARSLKIEATRDADAAIDYPRALAKGRGKTATDPGIIKATLDPRVSPIIERLQQLPEFAGLDADDPTILHEVVKELNSRSADLKGALGVADPRQEASRSLHLRALQGTKQDVVDAMTPLMPEYPQAMSAFKNRSQAIEAIDEGRDAFQSIGKTNPATEKSPESALRWLEQEATPAQRTQFIDAVRSAAKEKSGAVSVKPTDMLGFGLPYAARKAAPLSKASTFLRSAGEAGVSAPTLNTMLAAFLRQ